MPHNAALSLLPRCVATESQPSPCSADRPKTSVTSIIANASAAPLSSLSLSLCRRLFGKYQLEPLVVPDVVCHSALYGESLMTRAKRALVAAAAAVGSLGVSSASWAFPATPPMDLGHGA